MKQSTTADRLKEIMESRGLKQADIFKKCQPYCKALDVKMNRNNISQYVSGTVSPMQKKLTILSLALNVNEAWLMGYDVSPEQKEGAFFLTTDDEKKIILALRNAPPEVKVIISRILSE